MSTSSRFLCRISCTAFLTFVGIQAQEAAAPSVPGGDLKPVQMPAPTGEYQVVELTLEPGGTVLRLAFRGSAFANLWFIPTPWCHSRPGNSTLVLDAQGLRGELSIRFYDEKGTDLRDAWSLKLDLKRDAAGNLSGSMSVDPRVEAKTATKPRSGTATGKNVPAMAALAEGSNWPAMGGPDRTMATPYKGALIDDLTKAVPVWRSERTTPVSYGNAADGRYPRRAIGARLCGGSSSPVVKDGVVFQGFYTPSKQTPIAIPDWALSDKHKLGKPIEALAVELKLAQEEKTALEDFYRPLADEHLVAMDAATGKTLWETVWPQRSWNMQGHKYRGGHGGPLVAAGKVFYPSLHGILLVADAKTGAPAWEKPEKYAQPDANWTKYRSSPTQSPVLVGDILIWFGPEGSALGLAAADGSQKWQAKELGLRALREFTHNGKPHVLACGSVVALIDPVDGHEVWRSKESVGSSHDQQMTGPSDVIVSGDRLLVCDAAQEAGKIKKGFIRVRGWRITPTGLAEGWSSEDIRKDENGFMAVANGRAYLVNLDVRIFDVATGKQVGTFDRYPGAVGSNQGMVIIGNKGLLWPEGQHGSQGLAWYHLDQDRGVLQGKPDLRWNPFPPTSAYSVQPLVPALVDGRLFVRGGDGIYCYDLRAKP